MRLAVRGEGGSGKTRRRSGGTAPTTGSSASPVIVFDAQETDAGNAGLAVLDHAPSSPAILAITELAQSPETRPARRQGIHGDGGAR